MSSRATTPASSKNNVNHLNSAQLQAFFELSLDLLCIANAQGYFTAVTPAFARALGYSQEELLSSPSLDFVHPAAVVPGQTVQSLLPPELAAQVMHELERSLSSAEPRSFEYQLSIAGETRDYECRLQATRNQTVVGLIRDITAHKQPQRSLQVANEHLDHFADVASHDLRSPMRKVQQLCQMLIEDPQIQLSPQAQEYAQMLHQNTERMKQQLDDLLRFARAGTSQEAIEPVHLATLLRSAFREVRANHPEKQPSIDARLAPRLERVINIARPPLEHVLRNLLDNAIKHSDRPIPKISAVADISDLDQGAFLVVHIEDDGPGIAPKDHERVFQIFQSLRQHPKSTGMGLALAQRASSAGGGQLTLTSPLTNGRGARFSLRWPLGSSEKDTP